MVKIYSDGANIKQMVAMSGHVAGYTTNPSLMRKAGVTDYAAFAKQALDALPNKPISFEVFSDDREEMYRQAREIASWGEQVYVKIPFTNTRGDSCAWVVSALGQDGIKVNITAITTISQIERASGWVWPETPSILSIFAGRIADTGLNPVPFIKHALRVKNAKTEILWASTREILNVYQAEDAGCNIITVPSDMLWKLALSGQDLVACSLDTIAMFHRDAQEAGYAL